jgi:hypothetical protein
MSPDFHRFRDLILFASIPLYRHLPVAFGKVERDFTHARIWQMIWKKPLAQFVVMILMQFYTAFVVMNLWNWFVTRAVHAPAIGYLTVYGLLLIVQLFRALPKQSEELKYKRVLIMLDACVRDSQRAAMADELRDINKEMTDVPSWMVVETLVGNTIVLVLGWLISGLIRA